MTQSGQKYKTVAKLLLGTFWFLGCCLFPVQELIPSLSQGVFSSTSLIGDLMIIFLGLWTLKNKTDKALYLSLIAISIISAIVNTTPLFFFLNGMRSYLVPVSMLPIFRYFLTSTVKATYFIKLFEKSLYVFLLLQFPVMVIQCIRWGAFDNVGGTLGWMMSGPISTLIYVISFYLMVRRWDYTLNIIKNLKRNWILLVALFPSMLNETKVSFVYLALYFLCIIPFDKQYFKRIMLILPIGGLAICGFAVIYSSFIGDTRIDQLDGEAVDNVFSTEFVMDYVFGNDQMKTLVLDGYMDQVMPEVNETDFARGMKFAALPIILEDTPHSIFVGFGPSQFKGGTHVDLTTFAQSYSWILQGTQMTILTFIIDLGLLGILWLIWYLLVMFSAFKHFKHREKRLNVFMACVMIISILYIPLHILIVPMIIIVYVIMLTQRWDLTTLLPPPSGWMLPPISITRASADIIKTKET